MTIQAKKIIESLTIYFKSILPGKKPNSDYVLKNVVICLMMPNGLN